MSVLFDDHERESIEGFIDWCGDRNIFLIEPENDGGSWHHNSEDLVNRYLKQKASGS